MSMRYLVYENHQAENKAVVHNENCGHSRTDRLNDYTAPNDRWFGFFNTENEAIAFASLFPNRQLKLCQICMQVERANI